MHILKMSLWMMAALVLLFALVILYLLQPSGKVSDFQHWQKQAQLQHKISQTAHAAYTVKFFGVSTLLFDDGKDQILIDGFFSRPSLSRVLFKKIESDRAKVDQIIQAQDLKRTRAILVTHSHYDHALDVPYVTQQLPQANVIGSKSTLNIARGMRIPESQLKPVKAWQPMQIGAFTITAIPSQHTPATAVNNDLGEEIQQPLTLPARFSAFKEGGSFDYLIQHDAHRSLVKASTGAVPHQLKNLKVDHLFLGIAQLSKQSADFQDHYLQETLTTLKPHTVVPIHWDNFFAPLAPELEFLPRVADDSPASLNILIQAAKQQKTQLILLSQPVSFELGP